MSNVTMNRLRLDKFGSSTSLIWAKSLKIWAKKFRHFLAILLKLYFFVTECINKSLSCHTKAHYHVYKLNKIFLAISCFILRQLMSN